ncbi:MAG TPA: TonB-dependent receptor [Terriglobales bacterium]|nr:TonB-dependent receptor [Terriglobales bacterium]
MLTTNYPETSSAGYVQRALALAMVTLLFVASSPAQNKIDVTTMSVEDLMNMQVTSVSKRTQKVADAAAAIFVLTQEDIRRSGAASIPEALRLVPGVQVARIDENKWAISSRGFNGRFANKLLVLIDGRSVYTPLFSGVYWNAQDVMLEDVDRIEVIRGPGATLWGANAVNGVINIITKSAKATQSALVAAGGGTEMQGFSTLRYGGRLNKATAFRGYAKYFTVAASNDPLGRAANDNWNSLRGGFRGDWTPDGPDSLTFQGDLYRSRFGETLTVPSLDAPYSSTFPNRGRISGGNVLGRWTHTFGLSSTSLQMYFDNTNISDNSLFTDRQNIFDIDFQHTIHVSDWQQFIWGIGYRSIADRNNSSFVVSLLPDHSRLNEVSGFAQDEISLFDKRLQLTIGSKLEHNDFTGLEVEPNARILWNITPNQSVWTAVSRAVRTPALTERGLQLISAVIPPGGPGNPTPLPVEATVFGSNQFKSEDLLAYEAGYRVQLTSNLSADIATFYNFYTHLRTAEPGAPFLEVNPAPMHLVAPFVAQNKMHGGTYGAELFADWRLVPKWKLAGSYSYLQMNLRKDATSLDPTADNPGPSSPRHQFYVRSSLDVFRRLEHDLIVRYVEQLPGFNIPSYYSVDTHFTYKLPSRIELSVGSRNLLNKQHLEFVPDFINTSPTKVGRTVYGSITWRPE